MSMGLVGLGSQYRDVAKAGLSRVAQLEEQRNTANTQLEAGHKAARASNIGTGAGIGLAAGMSAGATYGSAAGPVGALIGAAVGYLASELF